MLIQDDYKIVNGEILYHLLKESLPIAYLSTEGKFLSLNDRFLEVFHYTVEDLYMKDCTMLLEGHMYDIEGIARSIHQGETWRGETCFVTKYGELKYLESTFLPLTGPDGVIEKVLSFHIDRTDQKNAIKWKHIAYRNELTNLPNRRQLIEAFDYYVTHVAEFAVLYMDIDHFKAVNDTYGHTIGDLLLYQLGKRLTSLPFCKEDVYHVSGDEFIILLQDMTGIEEKVETVHVMLRDRFVLDSTELEVSASIGISRFPHDSKNPGRLLELADRAMYQSKALKRG